MQMIQGTALRLKDPLRFDETGERNIILRLMVHLHNFHTAVIGINQIMNSFTEKKCISWQSVDRTDCKSNVT